MEEIEKYIVNTDGELPMDQTSAVEGEQANDDGTAEDQKIASLTDDDNRQNFTNPESKKQRPDVLYAGFWKRLGAYLLDLFFAYNLAGIILSAFLLPLQMTINGKMETLLTTVIVLLYFCILTFINNGQTIGKMIFGLRVVELERDKLRFSTVVVRELFVRYIHFISIFPILYLITAFTKKKQNLLDIFADTSVIDEKKEYIYHLGQG